MFKRYLSYICVGIALSLWLSAAPAKAQVVYNPGGGGGGITLPGGASSTALPIVFWDLTPGAGKTYTVPTGATKVELCIGGAGGGGGGATTGGSAGVCGGTGASAGSYCVVLTGASLAATPITYTVATGGAVGVCSAAPTAGGNIANGGISLNGTNIANTNSSVGTSGGALASTTTSGVGGTIPGVATSKTSVFTAAVANSMYMSSVTNGLAGSTGGADAPAIAPFQGGGAGGQGACVTSGGVCDGANPGSAGGNGWFRAVAYFN